MGGILDDGIMCPIDGTYPMCVCSSFVYLYVCICIHFHIYIYYFICTFIQKFQLICTLKIQTYVYIRICICIMCNLSSLFLLFSTMYDVYIYIESNLLS